MPSSLEYLLNRYANNTCTSEEKEELMQLLQQQQHDETVRQLIDKMLVERPVAYAMPAEEAQAVLQAIFETGEGQAVPVENGRILKMRFRRIMVAAAILVLITVAGWVWLAPARNARLASHEKKTIIKNEVAPGGNKAMLTLANGTTIVLDDAANGALAKQGSVQVIKLSNGQLLYKAVANDQAPVTYNTLSTPKGGQYQVVLPDGSKVWLNAASSIRFPTAFTGAERKVQISGEAYFEVAHNSKMPFIAEKGAMTVQVLGTHFNVNAYDDEDAIKTTLLEGSVKIVKRESSMVNGQSVMLKPGEQASVSQTSQSSQSIPVQTVDVELVVAWKNGLFHFENADIKAVMRQLSRWYDVDVEYKGTPANNEPLFMEIPRNTNLSDVLKVISLTAGVQLTVDGKKIIVQ